MPKIRHKKRNIEITIRVNEEELAELKKRQQGATTAGWIRDFSLGATPIKQADPDLIRVLGRIGSNLNQTIKYVNTHKELDQSVLEQITAIKGLINKLLNDNLGDDHDS